MFLGDRVAVGYAGAETEGPAGGPLRLLLPVPSLEVSETWDVGLVHFHPAGSAVELVEEARRGTHTDVPEWFRDHSDRAVAELGQSAVAEAEVTGGIDEAIKLVESALAIMRAVQHIENPMSAARIQTFGLLLAATVFAHESAAFGVQVLAGAGVDLSPGCRAGVGSGCAEEGGERCDGFEQQGVEAGLLVGGAPGVELGGGAAVPGLGGELADPGGHGGVVEGGRAAWGGAVSRG